MATQRRRQPYRVSSQELSRRGERKRIRVWLLEGVIVLLIGLNAYLLYSVLVPSTSLSYQEYLPLPTPPPAYEGIQVEVLNGCGESGISQQARKYLRTQGFDVVNVDNAENFDFPETVVLDRAGRQSVSEAARAVALALGATHVILQRNDDRMVEVTAIIGRDFDQLRINEE